MVAGHLNLTALNVHPLVVRIKWLTPPPCAVHNLMKPTDSEMESFMEVHSPPPQFTNLMKLTNSEMESFMEVHGLCGSINWNHPPFSRFVPIPYSEHPSVLPTILNYDLPQHNELTMQQPGCRTHIITIQINKMGFFLDSLVCVKIYTHTREGTLKRRLSEESNWGRRVYRDMWFDVGGP